MHPSVLRSRIQFLREQVETSRLYCASFPTKFQAAQTEDERTEIAFHYNEALQQTYRLEMLLETLERSEREQRYNGN